MAHPLSPAPSTSSVSAADLRALANDTTIFAGEVFRERQRHHNIDDYACPTTYCCECGHDWPCLFRRVYDHAEAEAHALFTAAAALDTAERALDASRAETAALRAKYEGPFPKASDNPPVGTVIGYAQMVWRGEGQPRTYPLHFWDDDDDAAAPTPGADGGAG